jgi:hypothetical protein
MLVIVLCRFCVPIGKYLFKINQHYSPCCWETEPLILSQKGVAAIPASRWGCNLDLKEKLIQKLASCLKAELAVQFWHEIIEGLHKEALKLSSGSCLVYPPVSISLVKATSFWLSHARALKTALY